MSTVYSAYLRADFGLSRAFRPPVRCRPQRPARRKRGPAAAAYRMAGGRLLKRRALGARTGHRLCQDSQGSTRVDTHCRAGGFASALRKYGRRARSDSVCARAGYPGELSARPVRRWPFRSLSRRRTGRGPTVSRTAVPGRLCAGLPCAKSRRHARPHQSVRRSAHA